MARRCCIERQFPCRDIKPPDLVAVDPDDRPIIVVDAQQKLSGNFAGRDVELVAQIDRGVPALHVVEHGRIVAVPVPDRRLVDEPTRVFDKADLAPGVGRVRRFAAALAIPPKRIAGGDVSHAFASLRTGRPPRSAKVVVERRVDQLHRTPRPHRADRPRETITVIDLVDLGAHVIAQDNALTLVAQSADPRTKGAHAVQGQNACRISGDDQVIPLV